MIDLEQARRRAKERVRSARDAGVVLQLTAAQHELSRELGYASWPALVRDTERFSKVDASGVPWERIRRVTVVCLLEDPSSDDGVEVVLHERDGRWVVPTGVREPGEDVWDDSVLRIPLATAGFRRQATHPLALDHDRRHVAFWVDGGRYTSGRLPHVDVPWWTGSPESAIALLRSQGDGALAALVSAAAESWRTMPYAQHVADVSRTLVGPYLSAATPQGGSGFGGSSEEWRSARGVLVDALPSTPVSFLDQACANGHLAVSMVGWAAERDVELTPYGVDISPELVARAQADHPSLASHFFVGDALSWVHPSQARFDVVHVLLDVVPPALHGQLISHQLAHVVAPDGRLILSDYSSPPARSAEEIVSSLGFGVAGRTRQPTRGGRPRGCPSVWVTAPVD